MKNAFEYEAELAALREELAKTHRSASELANAMTLDVPDLSPDFELFDYTCGVIGQIDNMYAGMRADRNAIQKRLADAERRNASMREALETLNNYGFDPNSGSGSWGEIRLTLEDWNLIQAALNPTESGASE